MRLPLGEMRFGADNNCCSGCRDGRLSAMRAMRRGMRTALWVLPIFLGGAVVLAQPASRPGNPPAVPSAVAPTTEPAVAMDFPAEGIDLKALVDIVTKRLHIPIIYDDAILNKKVIVRVPVNVPESALL